MLSIWGFRARTEPEKSPKRFPLLGSFIRLTLVTMLSSYGLWFWFSGLGKLSANIFTFLLVKADVGHAAHVIFKIQSVLVAFPYAILLLNELLLILCVYLAKLIADLGCHYSCNKPYPTHSSLAKKEIL